MQFHDIAYAIIILEKRASVRDLAGPLGMKTLYARLRERGAFRADEIKAFLKSIPDIRLVIWLLTETHFVPVERSDMENVELGMLESIRKTALTLLIETSEAAGEIEKALGDQKIDHREAHRIRQEIQAAERAIITLREHVR